MAPSDRMTRITTWCTSRGEVVQVSVAVLDEDSWEPLAIATEHVGPFDDVDAVLAYATEAAVNLSRGQYAGQQSLAL